MEDPHMDSHEQGGLTTQEQVTVTLIMDFQQLQYMPENAIKLLLTQEQQYPLSDIPQIR